MRILAQSLLNIPVEFLWENLRGEFTLIFDDGEIQTNFKETIYSHYAWGYLRSYPHMKLSKKHHVNGILAKSNLSSSTHIRLLEIVLWDCYDQYVAMGLPVSIDDLARLTYEITNKMYNELSINLEHAVVSLDITDVLQVVEHPAIKEVLSRPEPTQAYISETYKTISGVLGSKTEMPTNVVSRAWRASLVKSNQVLQCIGPRGYVTDIDSHIFQKPIMRGYAFGLRSFYDSLIESRSMAKSLYFSKADLQNAEYFSRKLQLLDQVVQRLHHGDCGSKKFISFKVDKEDLTRIVGKFYIDETGNIRCVRKDDTHLIGKTIKIRSVIAGCQHPDPYGICSTCFGELSLNVPDNTNIGQYCGSSLTQKISQAILSVKHLDGSSSVESIILSPDETNYLTVSKDGMGYMLADNMKGKKVSLVINAKEADGLTDINEVDDVSMLGISRVSRLSTVTICVSTKNTEERIPIVVSRGKRMASLTLDMLTYIRTYGWDIDDKNNFVIDLSHWMDNSEIMSLPAVHFNMSDVAKEVSTLLESSKKKHNSSNGEEIAPEGILWELYDLLTKHVFVNFAVLEVVVYGATVISMKHRDFRLPKANTSSGMGVSKITIPSRSMSAAMAYEQQDNTLCDPLSYLDVGRPSHPMDVFIMPKQVMEAFKK